jgi:dienelactone hydrolase
MPTRYRFYQLGFALLASAITLGSLGCANTQQEVWNSGNASRVLALANAVGMPERETHDISELAWTDATRQREVLAKLYLPAKGAASKLPAVPLVVFSHGIGGSREGYTYLGKYLAANGIAALHLQHAGSDRNIWFGNPLLMVNRLQNAAKETEAIDRAKDVSFALDKLLGDTVLGARIDPARIAAAGHSYGANTTLLVSGARLLRQGQMLTFTDARIKASVVISAPPFYGEADPKAILGGIVIPTLHITATGDEIKIPGYYSGAQDRVAVYEAVGTSSEQSGFSAKTLVVFKEGSHSMFTDRLGTGGAELNPKVKIATRELTLAFLKARLGGDTAELNGWEERHKSLLSRFERGTAASF